MIHTAWYYLLRSYLYMGLRFFFSRFIVKGTENIPKGPAIFASNHQNAFLDGILMVCTNHNFTHFLVRADIFKKPFVRWWLSTLNLIPIFRIRDGWQSLGENQKTFDACTEILRKGESIIIFPEGNHGEHRRIRPLSKGFTRLPFEAIAKNPDLKIHIVPVGLNYSNHQKFRGDVSIIYDKPILANDYFKEPLPSSANALREELSNRLKKITVHVESNSHYHEIIDKLEKSGVDYLDPVDTNNRIQKLERGEMLPQAPLKKSSLFLLKPIYYLLLFVNIPPLSLWRKMGRKIKDPVFVASLKFAIGIFLFPFYYLVLSLVPGLLFGFTAAAVFFILLLPSMILMNRLNG